MLCAWILYHFNFVISLNHIFTHRLDYRLGFSWLHIIIIDDNMQLDLYIHYADDVPSQRVSIKITINILWIFTYTLLLLLLSELFRNLKGKKRLHEKRENFFSSLHFSLLLCNHIHLIWISSIALIDSITTIATIFVISVTVKSLIINMCWKLIAINERRKIWISVRFIIVITFKVSTLWKNKKNF